MSWFHALKDDFTLRPFENQQTSSDSAAMASGPPDVMANQEAAEVAEECSGKKKSKFQTFKKFFARKKRKEASVSRAEAVLKASQSSDNVNNTPENNTLTRSEKGTGSKASLGSKALSHDSVFVSDLSETNEALGASQDSIHGKVKSLQLQLKQAIRLGSPPSLVCLKRTEDAGTMSEDDGLPCSPPEYSTQQNSQPQRQSSLSLEGTDSDEDQLSCATSSRAVSPLLVVPGDFSLPASPYSCLDNSAAKHKLRLRHKACNKRKPRVELRGEGDSVAEEEADESTSISDTLESKEGEEENGDVTTDQLRPEEEEGEKEAEQMQHSRRSLLRDNEEEEGEKEEDELGTGQDVSHASDTSSMLLCNSEPGVPGGVAQDAQSVASSEPSSRASSVGGTSDTPEPPAGQKEHLLDLPGIPHGSGESRTQTDSPQAGEDEEVASDVRAPAEGESGDEGGSFLQEVLSSLKTPLSGSSSLGLETDGVTLEIEEVAEVENEEEGEEQTEEEGEVKGEETEVDDPFHHQPPEPQEEEVIPLSRMDPSSNATRSGEEDEERDDDDDEEIAEVVEQLTNRSEEVEEEEGEVAQEVGPEFCTEEEEDDDSRLIGACDRQEKECEDEEEEEEEEEEEAIELEKEPEVEQERVEKKETWEEEEEEGKGKVEEAVEALEGEEEEKTVKVAAARCSTTDETAQAGTPVLEADKARGALLGEDTVVAPMLEERVDGDESSVVESCDQLFAAGPESPKAPNQSFMEHSREGEETTAKENTEMYELGWIPAHTQATEINQSDVDQAGSDQADAELDRPDVDQVGKDEPSLDMTNTERDQREMAHIDAGEMVLDQAAVSSQASPLSLPESQSSSETQAQEEIKARVPCMISADTGDDSITSDSLVSPSSEQGTYPLVLSPTGVKSTDDVFEPSSHIMATTELDPGPAIGEGEAQNLFPAAATKEEEARQSVVPPATTEETVKQLSSSADHSRVRFTITPAWQRSSAGGGDDEEPATPPSPSSPAHRLSSSSSSAPSVAGSVGLEGESKAMRDPPPKVEPPSAMKPDVVVCPGRPRGIGLPHPKLPSDQTTAPTKTSMSSPASTGESPVIVEGNPGNPFGVRLRKTAVLHHLAPEDDNTEPVAQPAGSKVSSPQPVSAKPSLNQPIGTKPALNQPISTKPALNQPIGTKPALPKKPDVKADSGGKPKHSSDPAAAARGGSDRSDSPSWISVARQRQKIYKDNSLDETTVKKEEPERKSSLPLYVTSSGLREPSTTHDSTGKVCPLETCRPAAVVESEGRRALSPPTPVPPQPVKAPSHQQPVAPKPSSPLNPAVPKRPSQRALSPPTPVPVSQRAPSFTSPPSLPKAPLPHPASAPSSKSPPPALPQDDPPWMALAKKKAKAWSEMPQIVQ
ncbi:capping protein-inhibiting regulator of actin dynamics isoform X2 [Lampris incognitus]|uniref:capping protein-inhibiting regulator of actin dynamics isoform X2 n=1 Tax=Lampris incognitus TaxID=2546036 RepID=UPI0024B51539|nr:capping protein-inhibiting regulator of actin dynamics isoform X2 [Lampris incognitus]